MSDVKSTSAAINPAFSDTVKPADKLPLYLCAGWGLGSAGTLALLNVVNGLVLKYIVDTLVISAVMAGSLIAITRILDAAIDPIMGMISDNTTSRWGRRRPFLLLGSFLCALTPIFLFAVPGYFSWLPMSVTVTFGLLFYAVAYTAFNVPYMAMPVEMTQNHNERTYLFSWRIYGIAIGGLFGGAIAPWLVTYFGEDAAAFEYMSYIIGVVIFITCFSCFALTAKAPVIKPTRSFKKTTFKDFKHTLKNRPFILLLVAKVFIVAGNGVGGAAMAFFVTQVLNEPLAWLGLFQLMLTIGMITSQFIWVALAKKLGKRKTFMVAASLFIITVLSWWLAAPGESQIVVAIRSLFQGIFGGGILLTTQSMLPDVLEHEVKITGVRHEGTMTGLYTTVERGSSALGVALAGLILSVSGYVSGADVISSQATTAIYICVAVVPAVMMACSIASIFRYDLPG